MSELLTRTPNEKLLLIGNEAIVRGALESGVGFASTYPGTPSSEIGDTFFKIAREAGMYFEYSINEKVALEVAVGAAHSGVRSICSMKHVGLNVAADGFMTLIYTGTNAGMIVVCADDPACHSSQNEQDNRCYSRLSHVPMMEPSTPLEAFERTKAGFEVSEELRTPLLMRTTTRVNHTSGIITTGEFPGIRKKGYFEKDPQRFVVIPAHARIRHRELAKMEGRAREISENSPFNFVQGSGRLGIVTSGVAYAYVHDLLDANDLWDRVSVLKLGMTWPLPERMIKKFFGSVDSILVAEELEMFLEDQVKALAQEEGNSLKIYGKKTGHFSEQGEFDPDTIGEALGSYLGFDYRKPDAMEIPDLPVRPPTLCPGCPHRATYFAAKKAADKDAIFSNDIGCYALGVQEPLRAADTIMCMGGGAGMAGGFSKASDQQVLAFAGDSTFFHSGIPALINGVHNRHNFVFVVLDNRTTAMTGQQPHPGLPIDGMRNEAPAADIEKVARGCGVEDLHVINPMNLENAIETFEKALAYDGFSMVIALEPCALMAARDRRRVGESRNVWAVNQETCRKCKVCINTFACPAMYVQGKDVFINELLCDGCGVCAQVCPFGAIEEVCEQACTEEDEDAEGSAQDPTASDRGVK